jgi:hypothetical protein
VRIPAPTNSALAATQLYVCPQFLVDLEHDHSMLTQKETRMKQPVEDDLQQQGHRRTRLSVKLVPAEHCSTQPALLSKAHPKSTLRPSFVLKLLLA